MLPPMSEGNGGLGEPAHDKAELPVNTPVQSGSEDGDKPPRKRSILYVPNSDPVAKRRPAHSGRAPSTPPRHQHPDASSSSASTAPLGKPRTWPAGSKGPRPPQEPPPDLVVRQAKRKELVEDLNRQLQSPGIRAALIALAQFDFGASSCHHYLYNECVGIESDRMVRHVTDDDSPGDVYCERCWKSMLNWWAPDIRGEWALEKDADVPFPYPS